jgi:metallophosphoesterase (TIGR00282 family)
MPAKVTLLFLGDLIGRPGRNALRKFLPTLIQKHDPSLIVANSENASGGLGLTEEIGRELLASVDVLTSGNHIWDKKETWDYLDREPRLLRPANYPPGDPGRGDVIRTDRRGNKVAVVNLQGRVFMEPIDCPFRTADAVLERIRSETRLILVDFHAEATSEKQALGWYLDGRVTAVLGTHTHVPTADERLLPGGTAYLSDVGMGGSLNSVIGMKREQAVGKFLTSLPQRFEPAKDGLVLAAAVVEADAETGRALSIAHEILKEDGLDD